MTEEILENLYRIKIPLPGIPLRSLNSYVIKAAEQNLIIDTGMNRQECMDAMQAGLTELGVNLSKTSFFITHSHADHLGLVPNLAVDTSKVYFNQPDADRIKYAGRWDDSVDFARMHGFPEGDLQRLLQSHPAYKYGQEDNPDFHILREGDTIEIGDYLFRCVATPGHTPGHMCLYEPNKKVLVAGDHILSDITPSIQLWSHGRNPLEEYLASLDKVQKLDIQLVLPGHREFVRSCRERIQELKHHHERRTDEVLSILEKGSQSAFQVASQMTWDVACDSWNSFPLMQKWFATGEAIAHLKYVEEKGLARGEMWGENVLFSLNKY